MIIIWELWVSFTQSKYGGQNMSTARIKYLVAKEVTECIARRWPDWDPFPPNWAAVIRRAENFGVQRVVTQSSWCKPPRGWVKVNLAVGTRRQSGGFIIRNAKGKFCVAGVYSGENFGHGKELREVMVQDAWAWCRRKRIEKVVMESDEPEFSRAVIQEGEVKWSFCQARVNCVASCLADRCEKQSLIFYCLNSLPGDFMQLLSLEGIPHFAMAPGLDIAGG